MSNHLLQHKKGKNSFELFHPTLRNLQSLKNTLHIPDTVPNDYTADPAAAALDDSKHRRDFSEME